MVPEHIVHVDDAGDVVSPDLLAAARWIADLRGPSPNRDAFALFRWLRASAGRTRLSKAWLVSAKDSGDDGARTSEEIG